MRTIVILLAAAIAAAGCHRREPAAAPAEPAPAAACGGRMERCGGMPMHGRGMPAGAMHGMHHRMMMGAHADSAAAPAAAAAPADPAGGCPAATRALMEQGRTVFSARGNCAACHGAAARGTPVAPDLTDEAWLHGDGSYGSIAEVVASGVPRPLRSPGAMPARGGADLAPAEVCAVAAYVRSLSSREGHEAH